MRKLNCFLLVFLLLSTCFPLKVSAEVYDPYNPDYNRNNFIRNHKHDYLRAENNWEVQYDAIYHEIKTEVLYICKLCGKHSYEDELRERLQIQQAGQRLEKHTFGKNGKCKECGYVKRNDTNQSEKNITFGRLDQHEHEYDRIEDTWVTKSNNQDGQANAFIHEFNTRVQYICKLCGRPGLMEEAKKETKTKYAYHKFDSDGKCVECGYGKSQRTKERERNAKRFYNELSRYDGEHSGQLGYNPLDDGIIRNMIREELERSGFGAHADAIINALWHTDAAEYRELCLWTFFDYDRSSGDGQFSNWTNSMSCEAGNAFDITVFFHETGHATDFSSSIDSTIYNTMLNQYKDNLFDALKHSVKTFVYDYVNDADNLLVRGIQPLSDEQKLEVMNAIVSVDNKPTDDSVKNGLPIGYDLSWDSIEPPEHFTEEQKKVFENALKEMAYDCSYTVRTDKRSKENSSMLFDALSGFTNNKINMGYGHDQPIGENKYAITIDGTYWADNEGNQTYFQNLEAYAEYFSSMINGDNRAINQAIFPEACAIMDQITSDALNIIKEERCVWTFVVNK